MTYHYVMMHSHSTQLVSRTLQPSSLHRFKFPHCFTIRLSNQFHLHAFLKNNAQKSALLFSDYSGAIYPVNDQTWSQSAVRNFLTGDKDAFEENGYGADEFDGEVRNQGIVAESMKILEWPLVCAQIAPFCKTSLGLLAAKEARLPIGATIVESQKLLAETTSAYNLAKPLDFSGAKDVRKLVNDVMLGEGCNIGDLCLLKSMLGCAESLHNQLFKNDDNGNENAAEFENLSPLQSIMRNLDLCSSLAEELENCLDCTLEVILDKASTMLADIRRRRRDNMVTLESLMKNTANKVVEAGGIDSVVITRRRARICIAVRTSYKSLLPGGVVLDMSNTGATSFMEPEEAIELNNLETKLEGMEKAAELAVLERLSMRVAQEAESILELSNGIMLLDLACARAAHANWLGAVRPALTSISESQSQNIASEFLVDIENIHHPLLLGPALLDATNGHAGDLPVPVDIKVKSGVKVVVISGPNTGGKTVTMKTLGIAVIMAKAGLFLPVTGYPKLPWFDHVFADIGDSQSLEQNLSTFSGHIKRLSRVLQASATQSLVLIDEIGGGTDPLEGSALAAAILKWLSKSVCLTVATTHSSYLKTLKSQDSCFENASLEFDMETLRPTYRILWGIPGQSNALNIAKSLGLDSNVLKRAQEWLTKLSPDALESRQVELMEQLKRQRDTEKAHAMAATQFLSDVKKLHRELMIESENLGKRKSALKLQQVEASKTEIAEVKSRIEEVISKFQRSLNTTSDIPLFSAHDAQVAIKDIMSEYAPGKFVIAAETAAKRPPKVGEKVIVRSLGEKPAVVSDTSESESGYLLVQIGRLKLRVRTREVLLMPDVIPDPQAKQKKVKMGIQFAERQTDGTGSTSISFDSAVQTSKNTVDLRGLRVEDALQDLSVQLETRRSGSVIFVIHGIGSGAVKKAVRSTLERHPRVAKFEKESFSNDGCTIVYLK